VSGSRRGDVDRSLALLRQVDDQDALLESVCESAAAACGFDRVMLSRIEGQLWRPWRSYSRTIGDVERTFRNWIENMPLIRLDTVLAESALVIDRLPVLVHDVRSAGRVHGPMVRAAALTSYVAAPIVAGDRVIGLLHADFVARDVEPADRDLLWAFATGFGQVFERAVLLARIREQRIQVQHLMQTVAGVLDEIASAEVELARRGQTDITTNPSAPAVEQQAFHTTLTSREEEVLALMATGATNDRIAERLVIATGTVKSHVKQILRKLEVDNRAEAIAQYLKRYYGARAG